MKYTNNENLSFTQTHRVHFSQREKDCLQLLVLGMTLKEIACKLGLSPRTVESYLENLKNKMECDSKSQLIAKVLTNHADIHFYW